MNLKELEHFNFFKQPLQKKFKPNRPLNWTINILTMFSICMIIYTVPKIIETATMTEQLVTEIDSTFLNTISFVDQTFNNKNITDNYFLLYDSYIKSDDLDNIQYIMPVINNAINNSKITNTNKQVLLFLLKADLKNLNSETIRKQMNCNENKNACLLIDDNINEQIQQLKSTYIPIIEKLEKQINENK